MKRLMKNCVAVLGLAGLLLVQGCATKIKATASENPPPKEAFSAFGRIELKSAVFREGLQGDGAGLLRINENIHKDLAGKLESWNQRPANGRQLVIEPVVEALDFKHGAQRVLLGPLAGSSGVLMKLRITEGGSGQVVATPEFFQRADAMAAGFLMGVHDNLMLMRVANLSSRYVIDNFERAQGGPTGADNKSISPTTGTSP